MHFWLYLSLRLVKKIPLLVIASPLEANQSNKERLRLPRRDAPHNDNLLYEIAALPSVARNDIFHHNNGIRLF